MQGNQLLSSLELENNSFYNSNNGAKKWFLLPTQLLKMAVALQSFFAVEEYYM